jgi:hypothetical protein
MVTLLLKLAEYFHKYTSNNTHNYIVLSFLGLSVLSSLTVLTLSVLSWWRGLPPPPKELLELLEMELYALGTYAAVNAASHTTKVIAGKPGANTPPPVEPRPD